MLKLIHDNEKVQLFLGLIIGVLFGFLLQKGGATRYDVIINQLLLRDFTVVKIMLTAVLTGMTGIYLLKTMGLVHLHPKPGSFATSVLGGLIFGVGFGLLGYCPGTVAGAVGQGSLDALFGGVFGILVGAGIFASLYPRLEKGVLKKGDFGEVTIPQLFKVDPWVVIIPVALLIVVLLFLIEKSGL